MPIFSTPMRRPIPGRSVFWAIASFLTLILVSAGYANDIYQTAAAGSSDSWNGPAIWGGATATAGNNYFSATTYGTAQANKLNYDSIYGRVRALDGDAAFAGDSLTIVTNTELLIKEVNNDVATANLILDGGLVRYSPNSPGYQATLAGTLTVASDSYVGVEHTVDNSTLTINSTLLGSGSLSLRAGGTGTGLTVSFGGDLSGYTGDFVLGGGQSPLTLDFNHDYDLPNVSLVMGTAGTADKLKLDHNLKFSSFIFGTNSLPTGAVYTAAELNALFGDGTQFINGSGSLSVYNSPLPPPPTNSPPTNGGMSVTITNSLGWSVGVGTNGTYIITSTDPDWTFGGSVGSLTSLTTDSGADDVGSYSEINLGYDAAGGQGRICE